MISTFSFVVCVSADYIRYDEKVTAAEASQRCADAGKELPDVGNEKHHQVNVLFAFNLWLN